MRSGKAVGWALERATAAADCVSANRGTQQQRLASTKTKTKALEVRVRRYP
jgi:hypothetical protein